MVQENLCAIETVYLMPKKILMRRYTTDTNTVMGIHGRRNSNIDFYDYRMHNSEV